MGLKVTPDKMKNKKQNNAFKRKKKERKSVL